MRGVIKERKRKNEGKCDKGSRFSHSTCPLLTQIFLYLKKKRNGESIFFPRNKWKTKRGPFRQTNLR